MEIKEEDKKKDFQELYFHFIQISDRRFLQMPQSTFYC